MPKRGMSKAEAKRATMEATHTYLVVFITTYHTAPPIRAGRGSKKS